MEPSTHERIRDRILVAIEDIVDIYGPNATVEVLGHLLGGALGHQNARKIALEALDRKHARRGDKL